MISHQHRCIFVHIPKCAGTSVEDLIWPGPRSEADLWMGFVDRFHNRYQTGGLQHLTAAQIRQEVGDDIFRDYFKFAIVRNPWDKVISQYSYMARRPDLREFIDLPEDANLWTYLGAIQRREHVQWTPQKRFITDEAGAFLVDQVIRFERLDIELPPVLRRLGLSDVVPQKNASFRKADYREYYDDQCRTLVSALYRDDIEMLSYKF